MPKSRFVRLMFALFICLALVFIGRNLYRRSLNKALADAVERSDLAAVRTLLNRGADPNYYKPPGDPNSISTMSVPVLHLAMTRLTLVASAGNFPNQTVRPQAPSLKANDIACLLIQKGADVHVESDYYLQQACYAKSLPVLRCLLDRGADPTTSQAADAIDRIVYSAAPTENSVSDPSALKRHDNARQMLQLLREHGARLSLRQAVQLGDMAEVKARLAEGVPVDQHGKYQTTALLTATMKGSLEIMRLLLAHGADVNLRDQAGSTPLYVAAEYGDIQAVELLLAQGASVDKPGGYGGTPLAAAILGRHVGAIKGRHVEVARRLLASGADVNPRNGRTEGFPILAQAIFSMPEIVPELLKRGADVNGNSGEPLRAAIYTRRLALVEELLRRGAKVNPPPRLFVAGRQDGIPLVSGKFGSALQPSSPLMIAVCFAPMCTQRLLQAGANIEADKKTILAQEVAEKRTDLILPTLTLGADINGVDVNGETALTIAVVTAPTLVKTLLEHGANPDVASKAQRTPLGLAVLAGDVTTVGLLLAHGAQVSLKPARGHTALYWARKHRNADIIALLQQAGGVEE